MERWGWKDQFHAGPDNCCSEPIQHISVRKLVDPVDMMKVRIAIQHLIALIQERLREGIVLRRGALVSGPALQIEEPW